MFRKYYIGDGVYVRRDEFDPVMVWLETERDGVLHQIALGPAELKNLNYFTAKVWRGGRIPCNTIST